MDPELDFLFLFDFVFLAAKLAPGGNPLLTVVFPRFHVFLDDLLGSLLFFCFVLLLALVSLVKAFKVLFTILYLNKQRSTHLADFLIHAFVRKGLQSHTDAAEVFLLAVVFNPLFSLTHHALVHPAFLSVHQGLVSLLKQVEGVCCPFMATLIRMDEDRQHPEALPNLRLISLRPDLKDVVRIDELLVTQQPV